MTFARLFRALNASGARYLVVSGLAVVLHGHSRMTADTDLIVDLASGPARHLIDSLTALGFVPRVPVQAADFADPEKRRDWIENKNMQVFSMVHSEQSAWVVDLFVDDTIDLDDLYSRAVKRTIEGVEIPVIAIEDLIAMKQRAGRDIDRDDIRNLNRIREWQGEYRV